MSQLNIFTRWWCQKCKINTWVIQNRSVTLLSLAMWQHVFIFFLALQIPDAKVTLNRLFPFEVFVLKRSHSSRLIFRYIYAVYKKKMTIQQSFFLFSYLQIIWPSENILEFYSEIAINTVNLPILVLRLLIKISRSV